MAQHFAFSVKSLQSSLLVAVALELEREELERKELRALADSDFDDLFEENEEPEPDFDPEEHFGPFSFSDAYLNFMDAVRREEHRRKRALLDSFSRFFTIPRFRAVHALQALPF